VSAAPTITLVVDERELELSAVRLRQEFPDRPAGIEVAPSALLERPIQGIANTVKNAIAVIATVRFFFIFSSSE
jgi:hypothetical protein